MDLKLFPKIVDGKIDTVEFLNSARMVAEFYGRLGKAFYSIKKDMDGNIEKLTKTYDSDKLSHATLHDMILIEKANEKNFATISLLWLVRSLHCFEAMLKQVSDAGIDGLALDNIKEYLVAAYEETVKPYHRWITQQAFYMSTRVPGMIMKKSEFLKTLNISDNLEEFFEYLKRYVQSLRDNRVEVFQFLTSQNLFDKTPF